MKLLILICIAQILFLISPVSAAADPDCGDSVYEEKLPSGQRQLRMVLASPQAIFDPMGLHTKADFELNTVLDVKTAVMAEVPTFDKCLHKVGAFVIIAKIFRGGAGARLITGGKDLFIYADEIIANPTATIDLSTPLLLIPPTPAKSVNGNPHGADGIGGNAGADAGKLTVILGRKLFSFPKIRSVGGKGGQGGDGGNGVNSSPGVRQPDQMKAYYNYRGVKTVFQEEPFVIGAEELPPVGEYKQTKSVAVFNEGKVDDGSVNGGHATPAGNGGKGGTGGQGGKGGDVTFLDFSGNLAGSVEIKRAEENLELLGGTPGINGSSGTPGSGAPGAAGAAKLGYPPETRVFKTRDGEQHNLCFNYRQGLTGNAAPPGSVGVNPASAAPATNGKFAMNVSKNPDLWPSNGIPYPVLRQYLHMANSLFRSHQASNMKKANDLYQSMVKYEPDLTSGLMAIRLKNLQEVEKRQNVKLSEEAAEMESLKDKYDDKAVIILEALHRRGLLIQGSTYYGKSKEFVPVRGFEELVKLYEKEVISLRNLDGKRDDLTDKLKATNLQKINLLEDSEVKRLFNLPAIAREVDIAESNLKRSQQVVNRLLLQLENSLKVVARETEYLEAIRQLVILNSEVGDLTKAGSALTQTGTSTAVGLGVGGPFGGVIGAGIGFLTSVSGQGDQDKLLVLQTRMLEQEKNLRALAQKNRIEAVNDTVMEQWALLKEASLQLHNSLNERMIAYQRFEAAKAEAGIIAERGVRAVSGLGPATLYDKYLHLYRERLANLAYELLKSLEYKWKIRLPEFESQFTLDLNKWEDFDRLRGLVEDEDRRLQTSRGRVGLNPGDIENSGYERGKLEVILSETSLPQAYRLLANQGRTGLIRVDFEGNTKGRNDRVRSIKDFVPFPKDRKGAEILSVDVWYKPKAQSELKDTDIDCTASTQPFYVEASEREYFADYLMDEVVSFDTQSLHAGRDIEGRSHTALVDLPGGSYETPSLDFIHTQLFRPGRPHFYTRQSPVRDWAIELPKDDKFRRCLKEMKLILYYRYLSNRTGRPK